MKKMLMMAVMVLTLAFSAVCSASNGSVLDAQEKIVNNFLNGSNFKSVSSVMTEDMKKNFDEKSYNNFKEFMAKNYGKVSNNRLMVVEKRVDADVLIYHFNAEKVPEANFIFAFKVEKEKPMLTYFNILLPQKEEAPADEKK